MTNPGASFDEVFASVRQVQGWMTRDQAKRLWERASELKAGQRVVEIGSFHGRSLIVLAASAALGVEIIAIDPHGGNDRGPQEFSGYETEAEQDHRQFLENLRRAGVLERVTHVRMFSHDALVHVAGCVDLLYVDGAHRYKPARADIVGWGTKVPVGGTMLVHDSFSSIGVTLALLTTNFVGGHWQFVGRSQSMAQFTRTELSLSGRMRNIGRGLAQLPYFLRNLLFKVLIIIKLGGLTKLMGGDGTWPY